MKEELFPQRSSICYLCTVLMWKQKIKEVLLTKHRSEINVRFTRSDELEDMEGRLGSCCALCRNIKEVSNHPLPLWSLCTAPVKRICSAGKGWALLLTYGKEVGGERAAWSQQGVNLPWFDLTQHLLESLERQQCPQIRNSLCKQCFGQEWATICILPFPRKKHSIGSKWKFALWNSFLFSLLPLPPVVNNMLFTLCHWISLVFSSTIPRTVFMLCCWAVT